MGLISKIFGTYSQRQIKKILATVDKIEELAWNTTYKGQRTLPGYGQYGKEEIMEILKLAR